jgi:hypothetical protein
MKILIGVIVASTCLAASTSASEANKASTATSPSAKSVSDFSSVQRKRKAVATAPVAATPPRSMWTGPDPTKGPGIDQLRQLQREGRCVIDEGYGRYTHCNNH